MRTPVVPSFATICTGVPEIVAVLHGTRDVGVDSAKCDVVADWDARILDQRHLHFVPSVAATQRGEHRCRELRLVGRLANRRDAGGIVARVLRRGERLERQRQLMPQHARVEVAHLGKLACDVRRLFGLLLKEVEQRLGLRIEGHRALASLAAAGSTKPAQARAEPAGRGEGRW